MLKQYALVLTRNGDAAEDLVQDSLVRAITGADTWQADRDVRPWLLSIMHNTFISGRRRDRIAASAADQMRYIGSEVTSPDQADRVHYNQTIAALMQLPDEHREALALVAIEGLTYKDAADVLGIPAGTLMSRLARAREALRNATGRTDGDNGESSAAARPKLRTVR